MKFKALIWAALSSVALFSCNGTGNAADAYSEMADTLTHHAQFLTIYERPDGIVLVDISDPWRKDATLAKYALVHRDSVLPDDIPDNTAILRTPLNKVAAFSSVYTSAMKELDMLDALKGVADFQYFSPEDTVSKLVGSSDVVNLGSAAQPSVELIAANGIETVLLSPLKDSSSATLPRGVVPIKCADYMEASPIGRAEWILLFGELFDKRSEARAIFDNVIDEYSRLTFLAAGAQSKKPRLLVETETSGVWYIPAGESYAARLYADAGADYPWANTRGTGSLPLSLEEVAAKALDADVWLVRSYGYETTSTTLKALNPRYSSFAALKVGAIYSCDSASRNIFDDGAFHPERLLREYIAIFHPELIPDYTLKYFLHSK